MTDVATKKERAKRTPRSIEQVRKGVLALPLGQRVALRDEINTSITEEVQTIKAAAAQAEKIANGTK